MKKLVFFSDDLAARYGQKLYRVPIDLALGCPNRENRFGPGCVFCAEDGGRARHLSRHLDLPGQVARGIEYIRTRYASSGPYIAYFQAYTSTYAPAETLKELYASVLAQANFPVVIVGTRPDALPDDVIALLAELNRTREVWVELGIQSCCDRTLALIRRGHDFACAEAAAHRLAATGLHTACHLIAGLPGETREEFLAGADKLAKLPFEAVKLHQLLILKGTPLASDDFPVKPEPLNEYEYASRAAAFLRRLPDHWKIMRLTAEAEPETILAPKWWMSKGQFLAFFQEQFAAGEHFFTGVRTADGTPTLYHPEFRQHFHSLAGAASEARHKFIDPSALELRLRQNSRVSILDVGFGLGGNAAAAIRCAENTASGFLEILSLEYDPRVLEAAEPLYADGTLERDLISALRRNGVFETPHSRTELKIGDARTSLKNSDLLFDLIFQDGFSPDCNPELWSFDFVRLQKKHLTPNGAIVSYCSAFPYRSALLRTGLLVGESIPFGRKRGGTVAARNAELLPLPLPEKECGIILHSTAGVAYRDPSLSATRTELTNRREKTVHRLRQAGIPKWFKSAKEN